MEASVDAITRHCLKNKNPSNPYAHPKQTNKQTKVILGRAKNVEKRNMDTPLKKVSVAGVSTGKKANKRRKQDPFPLNTRRGHLKCHDNYLNIILKNFYFVTAALNLHDRVCMKYTS